MDAVGGSKMTEYRIGHRLNSNLVRWGLPYLQSMRTEDGWFDFSQHKSEAQPFRLPEASKEQGEKRGGKDEDCQVS